MKATLRALATFPSMCFLLVYLAKKRERKKKKKKGPLLPSALALRWPKETVSLSLHQYPGSMESGGDTAGLGVGMHQPEGTGPPLAPGKSPLRLRIPGPGLARPCPGQRCGARRRKQQHARSQPRAERQPRPEALASATESLCLSFCLAACTL